MTPFLTALFFIICVLLIVVVLLQKGRGGGLSAALGGMGSSAFGTRVGDVFTWVTIVLVAMFLLLAVGVKVLYQPEKKPLAAPVLLPVSQEVIPAAGIMVTVQDVQDKKIKVFYTTDGSEPDAQNGTEYEGAIRIIPPYAVVKAIAMRPGALNSPVTTVEYGTAPGAKKEPATQPAK